jgi:hypothetical protein
MAAALAVYEACFVQHRLAAGETGMVLALAASQSQARAVFSYCLGFLRESPVLAPEITDATRSEIRLRSGVTVAIHSNLPRRSGAPSAGARALLRLRRSLGRIGGQHDARRRSQGEGERSCCC